MVRSCHVAVSGDDVATLPMQLGMIGLGRMGANMVLRLMRAGHECIGYDVWPEAVASMTGDGMTGTSSLEEFVAPSPRRATCG